MAKKISRARPRSLKATGQRPTGQPAVPLEASEGFRIQNELGLHARAAALFVKTASQFRSEIKVSKGTNEVNGKSIMGLLMLAAAHGSEIRVTASGPDSAMALRELGDLIRAGFGER